jgi:hypothetical protein
LPIRYLSAPEITITDNQKNQVREKLSQAFSISNITNQEHYLQLYDQLVAVIKANNNQELCTDAQKIFIEINSIVSTGINNRKNPQYMFHKVFFDKVLLQLENFFNFKTQVELIFNIIDTRNLLTIMQFSSLKSKLEKITKLDRRDNIQLENRLSLFIKFLENGEHLNDKIIEEKCNELEQFLDKILIRS